MLCISSCALLLWYLLSLATNTFRFCVSVDPVWHCWCYYFVNCKIWDFTHCELAWHIGKRKAHFIITFHDHYVSFFCARSNPNALTAHRMHNANQPIGDFWCSTYENYTLSNNQVNKLTTVCLLSCAIADKCVIHFEASWVITATTRRADAAFCPDN